MGGEHTDCSGVMIRVIIVRAGTDSLLWENSGGGGR